MNYHFKKTLRLFTIIGLSFIIASCHRSSSSTSLSNDSSTSQSSSVSSSSSIASSNDSSSSSSISSSSSEYIPLTDPYPHIKNNNDRQSFYLNDYRRATSYEDAAYRSNHGLISGDISDDDEMAFYINHVPSTEYDYLQQYKVNEATYTYNDDGSFRSYKINSLTNTSKTIYYGGAYVTLEDVAAYLFAFCEAPINHNYDKSSGQSDAINDWGFFGRVNNSYFNGDTSYYKYEPDAPNADQGGRYDGAGYYRYHEMDFGYTQTNWTLGNTTYDNPYNNGVRINRGAIRFVFTASTTDYQYGAQYIPIEDRHVFLTINHYNDFIEYLNYDRGWGTPYGWMSAGNEYCGGMNRNNYGLGYYEFVNPQPKTTYPNPQLVSLNSLKTKLH